MTSKCERHFIVVTQRIVCPVFSRENEYSRLHEDVNVMRQMLIQYEHIIEQKDQTEENLNRALNLLYDKTIAYRYYYRWRFVFVVQRRQAYALALSQRFYDEKLKRVRWFSPYSEQ